MVIQETKKRLILRPVDCIHWLDQKRRRAASGYPYGYPVEEAVVASPASQKTKVIPPKARY